MAFLDLANPGGGWGALDWLGGSGTGRAPFRFHGVLEGQRMGVQGSDDGGDGNSGIGGGGAEWGGCKGVGCTPGAAGDAGVRTSGVTVEGAAVQGTQ